MNPTTISPMITGDREQVRSQMNRFAAFADDYRGSAELRSECDSDPKAVLARMGIDIPPGIEVRFLSNSGDTFHVVLPPDPNAALEDEDLAAVAGGKSVSSAGTVGTASCVGTLATTVSTAGTAASAASAGSVGVSS